MSAGFSIPDDLNPDETWEREDMHCPMALSPLSQDFILQLFEAINARFILFDMPVRIETRFIEGYAYTRDVIEDGVSPEDLAPMQEQKREEMIAGGISQWTEEAFPALMKLYGDLDAVTFGGSRPQASEYWQEAWKYIYEAYKIHYTLVSTLFYGPVNRLADFCVTSMGGTETDALRLMQGRTKTLNEVQGDLHALAELAKRQPEINQAVSAGAGSVEELASLDGGAEFSERFKGFVARHGHLGQAFDDLSQPSWAQDPSLLFAELRRRLTQPGEDPEVRSSRLIADSERLAAEARSKLRGDDLERFERLLEDARTLGPLTEDHNYWLDRMFHHKMHACALRAGERLVADGVIEDPDEVFHLHADEVASLLADPRPSTDLIEQRKDLLVRWRELKPPSHLGPEPSLAGQDRFHAGKEPSLEADRLLGHGACPGSVTGVARVVTSPADFARVSEGEIVIAPASNPSWVPLFNIIGGLVTNTGGVLSHAAVVAREFGIPAVVGVKDATTTISDGRKVRIDGASGEVFLL
jgi:pyruvate,water dikinase